MFKTFILICFLSSPLYALSIQDDAGMPITLNAPAERIISLSPGITENLFSIGAGSRIIGVSRYSDYPSNASKIPVISDNQSINLERIAALKPDLIIAWLGGNSPSQLAVLQQLNIPIFMQRIQTLPEIPLALIRLAQLTGLESAAAPIILKAYQNINLLPNAQQPKLSAFYQVWQNPLMTLNKENWVTDSLARCGAINLFADSPISAPTVNIESVLTKNPDLIISSTKNAIPDNSLNHWLAWSHLNATKENRLIFINDDHMNRASLRTLAAATDLCSKINRVHKNKNV